MGYIDTTWIESHDIKMLGMVCSRDHHVNTKIYIFVDDVRAIPKDIPDGMGIVTCRTYKQAIDAIDFFVQRNTKIILDLDHDLGCNKSGYDVAKYFISTGYKNMKFKVHSMNIVGRKNIIELLERYGYKKMN